MYLLFLNNQQIELIDKDEVISLTKQVNDIADVSNRQTNYSKQYKIRRTTANEKVFEYLGVANNTSNLPYKKLTADLINSESGDYVIYKGWAVINSRDENYYNIAIYDGMINFFKAIENITLTEVGLTELNHVKNLPNIVATWTNQLLPYIYNIADYNGKMFTNNNININIDYQVPSAKVPYLWNRIFSYIGYEFEGDIFNHEDFINLCLTYPKPVPTNAPVYNILTTQSSSFYTYQYWDGWANLTGYGVTILPIGLNNTNVQSNGGLINVLVAGSFRINYTGSVYSSFNSETQGQLYLSINDNLGNSVFSGFIPSGYVFSAGVGFKFSLTAPITSGIFPLQGSFNTTLEVVTGYTLGFDQAFIDFKVSDFVKQIMVRFALTPFPVPYTNKVKFLTLDEIFQNTNVQNWSNKFHGLSNEVYKLNRYAQNNYFKFKYNDNNHKHNDGYIPIDNVNLSEDTTLYQSSTFSIEPKINIDLQLNIYPIWTKTIKDNNQVEYKELDNRFYFQKSEIKNTAIDIGSDALSSFQNVPYYYKESYFRCSWQLLLNKWYSNITKILNQAKIKTCNIYLNVQDFANLEMDRLVFLEQFNSYYLINKVSNFVPNKLTKVELIEVDYYTEELNVSPTDPFIIIDSYNIGNCEITFNLNTNLQNGQLLILELYSNSLGFSNQYITIAPVTSTINNNSITFSLSSFQIISVIQNLAVLKGANNVFQQFSTPFTEIVGLTNCYVGTNLPNTLTLLNYVYQGNNVYRLFYDYDTLGAQINYNVVMEMYVSTPFVTGGINGTPIENVPIGWRYFGAEIKNTVFEVKEVNLFFLDYGLNILDINNFSKFRLKINDTYSNEIAI